MKGDITLKVIISFLIPFILLYSVSCMFYIDNIGILALLNCSVSIIIAYTLFYLRFGKIDPLKVVPIKKIAGLFMFCFLCFIYYLLITLIK